MLRLGVLVRFGTTNLAHKGVLALCSITALMLGCTPTSGPSPAPKPQSQPEHAPVDEPPTVEPEPELRPLAQLTVLSKGSSEASDNIYVVGEFELRMPATDAARFGIGDDPSSRDSSHLWHGHLVEVGPDGLEVIDPSRPDAGWTRADVHAWPVHSEVDGQGLLLIEPRLENDPTRSLEAIALDSGESQWKLKLSPEDCQLAMNGELVVIENPRAHRLLDAKTGELLRSIEFPEPLECNSNTRPYLTSEGLYLVDGAGTLHAYDLASGEQRWSTTKLYPEAFAATDNAVYVIEPDAWVVQALDGQSGKVEAKVSIGHDYHPELGVFDGGGAAGPLVIVHRYKGDGDWVLGRAPSPTAERYEVRGHITLGDSGDPAVNREVRVDEQVVRTDGSGRFVAQGSAIGSMFVRPKTPSMEEGVTVVELDGTGKYDIGTVEIWDEVYD